MPDLPEAALETSSSHIPVLDGVRGFAVLAVMACHLYPDALLPHTGIVDTLWFCLITMGWCGVDLFFVLSGFLITGILIRSKGRRNYFRSFYTRRILRIFPLYYLLLVVFFFIVPHFPIFKWSNYFWVEDGGARIWYWFFLNNHFQVLHVPVHQFLGVAWSLAIEEQYYFVYPTLVRWFSRKVLMGLLPAVFLGSCVARIACYAQTQNAEYVYYSTFSRLDSLAMGSLAGLIWAERERFRFVFNRLDWILLSLGIFLSGLSVYCAFTLDKIDFICYHPAMIYSGYCAFALFFAALILRLIDRSQGLVFTFFNARWLRVTGKYSYAMYLLHFPSQYVAFHVIRLVFKLTQVSIFTYLFHLFCSVLLTYGLAWLSWHILEGPCNRLKEAWAPLDSKPNAP